MMQFKYKQLETFLEITEIILGNNDFKREVDDESKSILLFSISKSKREALAIYKPMQTEIAELVKDASIKDDKKNPLVKNEIIEGKTFSNFEIQPGLVKKLNESLEVIYNKSHKVNIEKISKKNAIILSDYLNSIQTEFLLEHLTTQ